MEGFIYIDNYITLHYIINMCLCNTPVPNKHIGFIYFITQSYQASLDLGLGLGISKNNQETFQIDN